MIINKISSTLNKMGFWSKLIEKDSGTSSKSFFLVATTLVGILLLIVPVIVMLVEVWYNHTIATDMNGMAAYIASVATLFASAGITKAWSEYSENKFRQPNDNVTNNYNNTYNKTEENTVTEEEI